MAQTEVRTQTENVAEQWLSLAKQAGIVICASAVIAVCARLVLPLPFTPVPLTLANFGVLLVGLALGSKRGILRAGYFVMPMDETLGLAAVDFGGRSAAVVDTKVRSRLVGDLQAELVADFFDGFSRGAKANVHVKTLYGRSNHHKIEALFKAFARALRVACSKDKQLGRMLPSTKGLL